MFISNLKPAVSKYWLLVIAGLMWSGIGLMLCRLAYAWLRAVKPEIAIFSACAGIIIAFAANFFLFSRLAAKNINRLCMISEKTCVFAFQAWKSYFLIGFMIMLGIVLRTSSFPRHYLAIIYSAIGGALFLASLKYYQRLWQIAFPKI